MNVKKGLNKYNLPNRLLVQPSYSIYCETNDSYLLNYLIMNKSESVYYKNNDNNISDLLILNQSYVYDVDQNYFTMFSFKVNIDYYQFNDTIRLDKVYNQPGSYLVGIKFNLILKCRMS